MAFRQLLEIVFQRQNENSSSFYNALSAVGQMDLQISLFQTTFLLCLSSGNEGQHCHHQLQ